MNQRPNTLGDLKKTNYKSKPIKDELRDNLLKSIKVGEDLFKEIHGYQDTVIPDLERAILSRHNINLLGLRGQAKTRLARMMVNLLDEYIPIIKGSEINDDPFSPLSFYARDLIEKEGDHSPIDWIHRDQRFAEKLATPDVTVADLIGDLDPIKAANLKLSYNDERVMHFGMIPRANRSIFVINEIPDLQARIQVALFNILQEGDIQIRGFNVRMPLDIMMVFTANPEDYTNRGSIVTPLKDRIGSQILTHYPKTIEIAKKITAQETSSAENQSSMSVVETAKDLLEQVGFEARNSPYVHAESGVSARMSITAMENLKSTAELRSLKNNEELIVVRLSDFMGIIPSITGKLELVYEGEQQGAEYVALDLIGNAVKSLFDEKFEKIQKLKKPDEESPFDSLVDWFLQNGSILLPNESSQKEYQQYLDAIEPLELLVSKYQPDLDDREKYFLKELLLWGLSEYKVLKREQGMEGATYDDPLGSFVNGI